MDNIYKAHAAYLQGQRDTKALNQVDNRLRDIKARNVIKILLEALESIRFSLNDNYAYGDVLELLRSHLTERDIEHLEPIKDMLNSIEKLDMLGGE